MFGRVISGKKSDRRRLKRFLCLQERKKVCWSILQKDKTGRQRKEEVYREGEPEEAKGSESGRKRMRERPREREREAQREGETEIKRGRES